MHATEQSPIKPGHLAARGDFIYANEQRSTFNYINAAPQVSEMFYYISKGFLVFASVLVFRFHTDEKKGKQKKLPKKVLMIIIE